MFRRSPQIKGELAATVRSGHGVFKGDDHSNLDPELQNGKFGWTSRPNLRPGTMQACQLPEDVQATCGTDLSKRWCPHEGALVPAQKC
ncbi:hypothetical protein Q7C36_022764 [Tachysurus vachellii]|uniref:Uncharacterized protein n=1 Tax=Tachysurus vachellii TaxID=175792 RepID=A0AA88LNR3_TACVA|nr:hypothetical protein Q7C36_022764 [Tachysurus vachellii]